MAASEACQLASGTVCRSAGVQVIGRSVASDRLHTRDVVVVAVAAAVLAVAAVVTAV